MKRCAGRSIRDTSIIALARLQIIKLRDDYKAQEGDEFYARKFHNEVLDHGMPPIRLLREIFSRTGEVG